LRQAFGKCFLAYAFLLEISCTVAACFGFAMVSLAQRSLTIFSAWIIQLNECVIDIAPTPIFAPLKRLNDGMFGDLKMLGRMFVLRRIAAAHMSTRLAEAQMYPAIAHCQTFFTAISARCHGMDLIEMGARCSHDGSKLV
jgi:hypothetical protein